MTPTEAPQKLFVTLVHGTWGRGFFPSIGPILFQPRARWFEQGGTFHASLSRELQDARILQQTDALIWSSANSVRARDAAALQLADRIRTRSRDYPKACHLIVGHSHGGNVTLRVLHHLGGEVPDILVATLATPFMLAVRREVSKKERKVVLVTDVLAIIIAGILYFKASLQWGPAQDTSFDFWTEILPITVLVGAVLLRLTGLLAEQNKGSPASRSTLRIAEALFNGAYASGSGTSCLACFRFDLAAIKPCAPSHNSRSSDQWR
jgi:hypothetical protein